MPQEGYNPPPMAEDTPTPRPTVDLAEPLLAQVGAMGAHYDAWVHKSIGPTTAERLMGPKGNVLRFIFQVVCAIVTFSYVVWGIQILWGI